MCWIHPTPANVLSTPRLARVPHEMRAEFSLPGVQQVGSFREISYRANSVGHARLGHGGVLIGRHEVAVGLGDSGAGGVRGGERVRDGIVVGGHPSGLGGGRDRNVRVGKAGETADSLHRDASMK